MSELPTKPNGRPLDKLTYSEWELMHICWRLERVASGTVAAHVPERNSRAVHTRMVGLVRKGFLEIEPPKVLPGGGQGRPPQHFLPRVSAEDAMRIEIGAFLQYVTPEVKHLEFLREHLDQRLDQVRRSEKSQLPRRRLRPGPPKTKS